MAVSMLDVLTCKITVGRADPENPMVIRDSMELREVQSIEINDSYKRLIGTAKVVFPKGSVYRSTMIGACTQEGRDVSRLTAEVMENGAVIEKHTHQFAIGEETFHLGQRIRIQLGYNGNLRTMFEGYITGYNSSSQFVLECENLAYKLKLKQAPKFETPGRGASVNELLGEKYGLLKNTGFEIHSDTKKFDIQIGKVKITDNFTVADVLNAWSKYKLYCFLKYDADSPSQMPAIAVGRPYSGAKSQPVFPTDSTYPFRIFFNYHVAMDNLNIVKTDPKFLAVTGTALGKDQKFFEVTVRLNPEYDPRKKGSKEFQVVNATQISKKTYKLTGNTTAEGANTKTKVDLSTYTVVPYMSPNRNINSDMLVEEAIEYFRNYNLNGITGSLTLFGDLALSSGVQVELVDDRNASKNGVYLVEEVNTTFGVNGYRQKITIPYKIKGEKTTYGGRKQAE